MVEEIQAYRTSDGRVHEDEFKAVEHEARFLIEQAIGKNCTVEVMGKAVEVFQALAPLASAIMERRETRAEELPTIALEKL